MFSSCRDRLNFKIWTKTLQKIIHRIIPELYEVACICLPASAHFLMYYHFLLVHYQCHGDHIQTTFILTDFINVTDKKKNLLKRILINIIFWRSLQEVLAYSTLACYYAKIDHTEHAVVWNFYHGRVWDIMTELNIYFIMNTQTIQVNNADTTKLLRCHYYWFTTKFWGFKYLFYSSENILFW